MPNKVMNILDEIVIHKKEEVKEKKELVPVKKLEKSLYFQSPTVSLSAYITRPDKQGIIAEFKRKSPSKGLINAYADVEEVTIGYMMAGASALSVLTDEKFFGGKNEDLTQARKFNYCPILRKDFIVDEYQIIEARSIGADAILLIAEILSKQEIKNLAATARHLGLEVLMELHSAEEIEKICEPINVVGVNNRNLKSFHTGINTSEQMFAQLPKDKVLISESGLDNPETVIHLRRLGYQGFLIGEYFMKQADPAKKCTQFIQTLQRLATHG